MAKFASVSPGFWTDEMVRGWNDAQQKLALYLLTCEHRNLQGIYRLPLRYAADDLLWSEAKLKKHLGRLIEDGFVEFDERVSVVLLPQALRYYQPTTDRQLQGAIQALAKVPETPLKDRFAEVARQHGADKLVEAMTMGAAA